MPRNSEIPGLLSGKERLFSPVFTCSKRYAPASYYMQLLIKTLCINMQGEKNRLKDTLNETHLMGL